MKKGKKSVLAVGDEAKNNVGQKHQAIYQLLDL